MTFNAVDHSDSVPPRRAATAAALWVVACLFTQPFTVYAAEAIGTVTQVYDGTLTSDIQVNTFRHMLEAQIAQQPGAIMHLMAGLPRAGAPGTIWNYSTGETFVACAVVRAAVGRPLAEYLSERIWTKAGMESDATWWLESPGGLEIGGSGLFATLRDYGRFGLFLMNGGVAGGARILPDGWIRDAGSSKTIGGKNVDYGYMMWPFPAPPGSANQGAFEALGIYGQHIYVNPREHVVIVVWSALPKPTGMEVIADEDFFAAAAEALR